MSLQFPDRGPYSAGGSIQPHLRVLRAVGFCHLAPLSHPVIPGAPPVPVPLWYRLHSAYHVFAQCVTILFVLQQLVYAYQVSWHEHHFKSCSERQIRIGWKIFASDPFIWKPHFALQEIDDMDKLSNVLFVLLCHITCIAKQLVFHLDTARVDELIAGLDGA